MQSVVSVMWKSLWISLATLMVLFFSSCQTIPLTPPTQANNTKLPITHKKEPAHPAITVQGYSPATAKQLTFTGSNEQPSFSHDGLSFLYVSQNQIEHQQAQVYSMDLASLRASRLTYQDGNNAYPIYSSDGQRILYSSATDENKENPPFIATTLKRLETEANRTPTSSADLQNQLPPLEIYSSSLNGQTIKRLTFSKGFDGQIHFHPVHDKLVFSSANSENLHLYSLNFKKQKRYQLSENNHYEYHPQYSPNGKALAWVREDRETGNTRIMVGSALARNPKTLTLRQATYLSPRWHPLGTHILYSSNVHDDNFELYISKVDGSCVQRLTYSWSNEGQPAFSPDGKSILFTSSQSGANHIYAMAFHPPQACPEGVN